MDIRILFGLLLLAVGASLAVAEVRTWTDVKGRTLTGQFLRQDDSAVWLIRENGRQVRIGKNTLSEADRKHLEGLADLPGQGERFDAGSFDPSAWKPREGGFRLDRLHYPAALEGDHFIVVAGAKTRPAILAAYLEAAERLWIDMATDLPLLVETFKDRRMLIVLADEEDQAKVFATWHGQHAGKGGISSSVYKLTSFNIVSFSVGSDLADDLGLLRSGRLFRLDAKIARNTRLKWAERIHFLTSELIRNVLWSVRTNDDYTLSLLRLSYAYHREESICGRIETKVTFGGGEDIEGFSNGANWAGYTRKILARGHRPSLDAFLQKKGSDAVARDLGVGHGLMHFIHRDPIRLGGFNKLLEGAANSKKCPDSETFAKALGYASPAAFDAAWLEFMLSDEFE